MKSLKTLATTLLLGSLLWSGCMKEHDDLVPELEGVPAGGLTGVRVVNVEGDLAEIEVSLFAVDHFGGFITGLSAENFEITQNTSLDFSIIGISEEEEEQRGPFSASLLFDQSGSINSTDPQNARIEAGTSFAKIVNSGDEAAVAAFSSGGFYQQPYQLLVDFSQQPDELIAAISSLAGRADGGTPLYQSIYKLISYTSESGNNKNRAIIAFTDGDDTDGGVGLNDIVAEACAKDVRVYTVGLGGGVDNQVLSQIAFETGGAVMLAEDALQLISLYSSLGDLLHGEAYKYNLKLTVKKSFGDWQVGDFIAANIALPLSESMTVNYPLNVSISARQAGKWYEKLPACPCTYEEAQELANSVCADGTWEDCGSSRLLNTFHYGATSEVRWYSDKIEEGQQCTYDSSGNLITLGIAAGSPDKVSPGRCSSGSEWLDEFLANNFCLSSHCEEDVITWREKACWEYLRDWPASQGATCFSNNAVNDIQHMRRLVGDMTCEEVTELFIIVDDTSEVSPILKDYIKGSLNYTPNNLVNLLEELRATVDCNKHNCEVINTAIENLK